MRKWLLLGGGLLALLASGDAPAPRPVILEGRDEPVEMRLVRTIYIGAPVGLTREEIAQIARDPGSEYEASLLASGAALAVGMPDPRPDWPTARLLDHALERLTPDSAGVPERAGMFPGWDGRALVFALVRALATTGRAAEAQAVLEKYAADPGDYAGAVALVALKQIGSTGATRALRAAVATGKGGNLPENLLLDTFVPYLAEPEINSVPWDERSRAGILRRTEGKPCECMAADAAHFLGFLPRAADPDVEARELAALRRLAGMPTASCFQTRYLALRALALRSPETLDYWLREFDREPDPWTRDLLAQIGFARYGTAFADPALERLGRDPAQHVQWTLMHGTLQVRRGNGYYAASELWNPLTLQFLLDYPGRRGRRLADADAERLLAWLEGGARPKDPWVWNHLQYGLAGDLRGPRALRLVDYFGRRNDRAKNYWILMPLSEPAALPRLREWAEVETDAEARDTLGRVIRNLEPEAPPSGRPAVTN